VRVLQVIPSLASRTGGTAENAVQSSRALGALGLETTIYTTDLGRPVSAGRSLQAAAAELPQGAETLDIRFFSTRPPRQLAFSPTLYRTLDREVAGYDVVQIHSLYLFPQWAAYRNAARHGVPYVVTPAGILDPYHRQHGRLRKRITDALWQRRLLEHARVLHVMTEDEARLVADVAPAVPRVVAPSGVHWGDFQRLPDPRVFRERHLDGHDGLVVLHLGRVSHKKAPDALVRAFARAARDLPDARLVFVGPDDEGLTPRLRELAAAEGVSDRVTLTGMLPGEQSKLEALAAADVWALPSNADNFGIAVVEALAAGLPVVISRRVNTAPEIEAGGAAVVTGGDPEAFGAALGALLGDAERRLELGRRGREFAKRYDWAAVAPELAKVYERALEAA
jgi:glycosyltransferase involved in cell wall biosynthesis